MQTMKQMVSDVQIFIGTREMFKTVFEEIQSITSIINNRKSFEISIDINPTVAFVLESANQLGNISVIEKKSEFEFKDTKLDQAQKQVITGSSIDLQRKRTFYFSNKHAVSSCLILPNGHILIADFCSRNQIMELDDQDQSVGNLHFSERPYYLTLIDDNHIAVTYFSSKSIEILNLKRVRNKIIEFEKECCRISYQDDKLYVVVDKGIVVLDLSGHILDLLPIYTQKKCLLLPPKTGYISQILQKALFTA
ncbi:Hypothetical predicted protein [Mytilus galloprovincialis]|uniref:Uncharacterized protein n=1 Tax=Mytilus galloprovincialis TaxID=29158 RepID=A0A8B6CS51_MYTGA|nr:Hypothetical predicted protein [Mytilus galloprovincialis]